MEKNLELQKVLSYEDNIIEINEKEMWSATQMAKPFNKRSLDWLKLDQTQEYMKEVAEVRKITLSDLVQVTRGDNGSTWIHEKLVIEFARWCNIKFSVWCNDQIETLMRTGKVELKLPQTYLEALEALVVSKKEEERLRLENNSLTSDNEELVDALEFTIPLAEFAGTVADKAQSILMRDMAKLVCNEKFKMGEKKLYSWLREKNILMRDNSPYQAYINQHYFEVEERVIDTPYGTKVVGRTTKVTGRGQVFISEKMRKEFPEMN